MERRDFIALAGAFALTPLMAQAAAQTLEFKQNGDVQKLLDAGKTVFVDFYTTWCSTCQSQERSIEALRKKYPEYDKAMVFIKVDWDFFSRADVAVKYKIPRRSTLLVLRGNKELGRIVAGTSRNKIKALMDMGVAGA